jgi:hypothetical protein
MRLGYAKTDTFTTVVANSITIEFMPKRVRSELGAQFKLARAARGLPLTCSRRVHKCGARMPLPKMAGGALCAAAHAIHPEGNQRSEPAA